MLRKMKTTSMLSRVTASLPMTESKGNDNKNFSGSNSRTERFLISMFVLNVFIFLYLTLTPKETLVFQSRVLNDQLGQYAATFQKQQELMSKRYQVLTMDLEQLEKELNAAKTEEKETEIKAEIVIETAKVEAVKETIAVEKKKVLTAVELFCPECLFSQGEGKKNVTTCGARRDFLMKRYKNSEEAAVAAIAQWDVSCFKEY